ncbi:MAG TPA: hypothetical protein VIU13_20035, partial [Chryseolinea sp.]
MKFSTPSIFLVIAIAFCCSEEEPNSSNIPVDYEPAITPVGTPAGDPVAKTIGASGGSIASPDGVMELVIPAGALTVNTDITIQPITNESPGGIGLAYDLLPDGTTFNKPATLTFRYTDEDINGSLPEFLSIAHQNSDGAWVSDIQNQMLDTDAQKISLDIAHFTPFRMGTDFARITAIPYILKPGESALVDVYETFVFEQSGEETRTEAEVVPSHLVTNWNVTPAVGSLQVVTGPVGYVTYRAPANVETRQTVRVSAHVNVNVITYINRRRVEFRGVDLYTDIVLEPIPPRKYDISIEVVDSLISPFYGNKEIAIPVYRDQAKFEIELKFLGHFAQLNVSPIQNGEPTVTPATQEYGGTKFQWIPDPVGAINISEVSLTAISIFSDSTLNFSLKHDNATLHGVILQTGEVTETHQPRSFDQEDMGYPGHFTLDLSKHTAYYDPSYS